MKTTVKHIIPQIGLFLPAGRQGSQQLVPTKQLLVLTKHLLAPTRELLVLTKHLLALTRELLVLTKHLLVPTRELLVPTEERLALTKHLLVLTKERLALIFNSIRYFIQPADNWPLLLTQEKNQHITLSV